MACDPDKQLCSQWISGHLSVLSFQVLVNSPCWLPSVRIGKAFETHTLIGRLLRPSSLAPSLMQPSVSHLTGQIGHVPCLFNQMTFYWLRNTFLTIETSFRQR